MAYQKNETEDLKIEFNVAKPRDDKLIFYGNAIKLGQFIDKTGKLALFDGIENQKINHVEIFAFNTVVIDRDINENWTQLSIIAPKWKIIGNKKINLNGADGQSYPKAANDKNGLPGRPGAAGGNFFGIGKEFIDVSGLIITANGGNGGNGQEGGNGSTGARGAAAQNNGQFKRKFLRDDKNIQRKVEQWHIYGGTGGRGKNGCNGGVGGFGGPEGVIEIINLGKGASPATVHSKGATGSGGAGGKGGEGGQGGNDMLHLYVVEWLKGGRTLKNSMLDSTGPKGPNGTNGKANCEAMGQMKPENPKPVEKYALVINSYKMYLRENASDATDGFYELLDQIE